MQRVRGVHYNVTLQGLTAARRFTTRKPYPAHSPTTWPSPSSNVSRGRVPRSPSFVPHVISTVKPDVKAIPDAELDDILLRGRRYGLYNVRDLEIQTNFKDRGLQGQLLIDNNTLRPDLDLWCVLTDYAVARRGLDGARDIHRALWGRGHPIPLHDDTHVTNRIWHRLLHTSLEARDLRFVRELEKTVVAGRSTLWSEIVGACVVNGFRHARLLSFWYRRNYYRGLEDTLRLYEVCQAGHVNSFVDFMLDVRKDDYEVRGLYKIIIPRLWRQERVEDAFAIHNLLVTYGELPPTFGHLEPAIHELAVRKLELEPFIHRVLVAGGQYSTQAARTFRKSQENVSRARPLNFGEASTRDSWVARALATRGVSTDFVLNSLRMLGVRELGPLSIRQLGINAGCSGDLQKHFARLKELDVDVGSSSYVRLVAKFCHTDQERLLQQMVETSMHHDVFEDETLLKKLATERFIAQDWSQFNFLLATLHYQRTSASVDKLVCDMLLGLSPERPFQRILLGVLDNWYSREVIPVEQIERLILELAHSLLYVETPRSETGRKLAYKKRFPISMLKHAAFMSGVMQNAMTHGVYVSVGCWHPVFRYLEEHGQITKFVRLSVWLAEWYMMNETKAPYSITSTAVQRLFNEQWLKSYTHLALRNCFRYGTYVKYGSYQDMINFLAYLQSKYGLYINTTIITRALHFRVHKQAKLLAWRRHRGAHYGSKTVVVKTMLLKLCEDIRRRFHRDRAAGDNRIVAEATSRKVPDTVTQL